MLAKVRIGRGSPSQSEGEVSASHADSAPSQALGGHGPQVAVAYDPSAPFDFAQGRRYAGTSPRCAQGGRTLLEYVPIAWNRVIAGSAPLQWRSCAGGDEDAPLEWRAPSKDVRPINRNLL